MSELINPNSISVTLDFDATIDGWLTRSVKADSLRAGDIKNDKSKAVLHFFDWIKKSPEEVQPKDVQEWLAFLNEEGLALGTIYNRVSALSSYFEYLRNDVGLIKYIPINPAQVSRIKAPDPFQSETVKALTPEELYRLIGLVENYALETRLPVYLRDFAILMMFVMTGKRREEIMQLQGSNIEIKDGNFSIHTKVKGGHYRSFEMNDPSAQEALLNYLETTGRGPEIFGTDQPLWLRHSTGGKLVVKNVKRKKVISHQLSSHGFAKRMIAYAAEAGINNFHIHKFRHTFASFVANSTGSMAETQEALDHSDIQTTRVYVNRLKVIKDKSSPIIRDVLNKAKKTG